MSLISKINRPTLLVDQEKVALNIARMAAKARKSGVRFRPHFKTHQSADIGEQFREQGIDAITVSSVAMAEYFASHGWRDITIAFPLNLREVDRIDELAMRTSLGIMVESPDVVRALAEKIANDLQVWIKIDTGYGRTGILWSDMELIRHTAAAIQDVPQLSFAGLLTHAGHTYGASPERIGEIYQETKERLFEVREQLSDLSEGILVSVGDTPGCSLVDDLSGVDEIRPGNFVFFDLSQLHFGACKEADIAVMVACPVVAKHHQRRQIIIYGGAVHLSKESLVAEDGRVIYGKIAQIGETGWNHTFENNFVVSLSQEHGIIEADDSLFMRTKVGDLIGILPVHSCLTVNLFGSYLSLTGEQLEIANFAKLSHG